jgi:hypothetical protein
MMTTTTTQGTKPTIYLSKAKTIDYKQQLQKQQSKTDGNKLNIPHPTWGKTIHKET